MSVESPNGNLDGKAIEKEAVGRLHLPCRPWPTATGNSFAVLDAKAFTKDETGSKGKKEQAGPNTP